MNSLGNIAANTFWQRLSSQPHRLFFASSLIWGIVLMGLSFGAFLGLQGDFSLLHRHGMIYGLFINAFLGFLSTVIPRYTLSIEISKKFYFIFWLPYQIGLVVWFLGYSGIGQIVSGLSLIMAGFVYYRTVRIGRYPDEPDSLWLVVLVFAGGFLLISHLFLSFSLPWITVWIVILPITFTVAQRMVPFFYAGYFGGSYDKPKWIVSFFVLTALGIAVGGRESLFSGLLCAILSLVLTSYLWNLPIYYKKAPAILWIMTIGFMWLPIGLLSVSLEIFLGINTLQMGIHILLLGFVFTLFIGFGTRVLLGHSGQQIIADGITIGLFILTQAVVILRIIASLLVIANTDTFTVFLYSAFVLFIIIMSVWGIKYRHTIF